MAATNKSVAEMFVYIYLLMRILWNHMNVRNSCLIAMTDDSALSSDGGGTFELQTENQLNIFGFGKLSALLLCDFIGVGRSTL